MTSSAYVAYAKGDTTDLMLILSSDTNYAARSISLVKLLDANLSRVRNLSWYLTIVMPSVSCEGKNSFFFWLRTVAEKW